MTDTTTPASAEGLPDLLRLWPTPWHLHWDGIKAANGGWIMSVANPKLAQELIDLANYAGAHAALPASLSSTSPASGEAEEPEVVAWRRKAQEITGYRSIRDTWLGDGYDLVPLVTLSSAQRAVEQATAGMREEMDGWKDAAKHAGVCMACAGRGVSNNQPEGCTDCFGSGRAEGPSELDEARSWAKAWHDAVEAVMVIAGAPCGLGASEIAEAFRSHFDTTLAAERTARIEAERRVEAMRAAHSALWTALATVMGDTEHGQRESWEERCRIGREALETYRPHGKEEFR